MTRNKIYTDKYASGSLGGGNRAAISIGICEKIIALMSRAKESLNKGDKAAWGIILAKVPDEVGLLISAVDSDQLGEWGDQMRKFYLGISFNIYGLVAGNIESSKADDLLQKIFEARDLWKALDTQYIQQSASDNPPETGGLI